MARPGRKVLVGAAAVAALIVLLVTVAVRGSEAGGPGGDAVAEVSSVAGARVGEAAPAVSAKALDGREIRLPSGKPTAVFFFAAWCGTCLPEARALGQLQRDHGGDISIVAVDLDPGDTPEAIKQFLTSAGDPVYPVVHDVDGSLGRAFEVTALDVTVITDATGKVVYRDAVPSSLEQLRDAFRLAGATV